MKTLISKNKLSRFGGVVPILKRLNELRIPSVINSKLGCRRRQSKFSYEDALISFMMSIYCHGFRINKIEDSKKHLSIIPHLNMPSHDTIGRIMKGLATKNEIDGRINPKNPNDGIKTYIINENPILNELLIATTKKMGLLVEGISYTLDVDATVIESEVYESKMTYKKHYGFTPMVCMIGALPVYISMRSGNANPHYKKLDCIIKCIELLKQFNLIIGTVRIDGAGYKNEVLEWLNSQGIKFVVGANWSERTFEIFEDAKWIRKDFQTSNHLWNAELSAEKFSLKNSDEEFNMCCIRIKDDKREDAGDRKTKWTLKKGYYHKFVITNDFNANPHDIFQQYHERGKIEKNFDSLKNDFGWRILPFSKLNENLVYMILTALTNNIFQGLLSFFCKKIKSIPSTIRLEKFREQFILVVFGIVNNTCVFYDPNVIFENLV